MTPTSSPFEQFAQTTSALKTIERDRRTWLANNPDNKSPRELNQLVTELAEIELSNSLSTKEPGDVLHVAAWNMERGRYWREAVQLWQEHPVLQQVDILCLSEMDNGMVRAGNEHTTRELALALGMNYAYGVEFLQLSVGTPREQEIYSGENDRGYHGNAILSRFPLQSVRMLRFPGIEKWYGSFEHRLGGRNAILADIQLNGQTVTIVSTHLESGPDAGDKRHQEGQSILEAIEQGCGDHSPIILCGDMNAAPTAAVIQSFQQAGLEVEETNDLTRSTFQEEIDGVIQPGNFHIDYIMTRGLDVTHERTSPAVIMAAYPCKPTGKMLSDHAIVVVDLKLP